MFFKELSDVISSGTDVSVTIRKQGELLTVSVFPKVNGLKDEAQQHMQPVVLTGTAEELDAGFFEAVGRPLQKVSGILSNMKDFEESLAKMEANRKEEQEKRKEAEKQVHERKVQFDKLMAHVEELEGEGNFEEALAVARKAVPLATGLNVAKANEKVNRLNAKCIQKSLF